MRALAPEAGLVVGMSMGGLTALCLTAQAPDLVRRLAVVDGANPQTLEIRFDTPEGSGSFWETLRRVAATAKRAAP
jgi:pimeloyl-ACP methyl ester carboxylesterase